MNSGSTRPLHKAIQEPTIPSADLLWSQYHNLVNEPKVTFRLSLSREDIIQIYVGKTVIIHNRKYRVAGDNSFDIFKIKPGEKVSIDIAFFECK